MRTRAAVGVVAATAALTLLGACSASKPTTAATPTSSTVPTPTTSVASPLHPTPQPKPKPKPTSATATPGKTRTSAARRASTSTLPLSASTHDATQVITVTAGSTSDTTARLQAWSRSGHGWQRYGSPVEAHLGSDGLSRHPSESKSATPIGSFTLTQAFGHDPNPGTALKYTHTTPADWWISQPGPLYNTRQRCSSDCGFNQGDPNEHLYYETPFYDYAVVIDYNTRNAPGGVHQGAGSAFFLHVTDGNPTAGCVSIPQSKLTRLMRWLDPARHPRILIGVA